MSQLLRIGTRGSKLALWQANWAREALEGGGAQVALEVIKTRGDQILDTPFTEIEGKGLFTKELDDALLSGRIDIAVHSLKDLPTELPEGLSIGALGEREDVRDALVGRGSETLETLKKGARVGTSSPRRQALLMHERPDLLIESIRGNVDTRIRKLEEGSLDAIVLATAGLTRLGLADRITQRLPADRFVPAPGQGAVAVLVRTGEEAKVKGLENGQTRSAVTAERTLLETLGGGCKVPIGAWGRLVNGELTLDGVVASIDGQSLVRDQVIGAVDRAADLGRQLAEQLQGQGAAALLAESS